MSRAELTRDRADAVFTDAAASGALGEEVGEQAWAFEGEEALGGVLDAFDGRGTEAVLRSLRAQGRRVPSEALLRALHHHRVLVTAEGEDGGITGRGTASSPQDA